MRLDPQRLWEATCRYRKGSIHGEGKKNEQTIEENDDSYIRCVGLPIRWIIWSSIKVHLVDALAAEGDEGRYSLR